MIPRLSAGWKAGQWAKTKRMVQKVQGVLQMVEGSAHSYELDGNPSKKF